MKRGEICLALIVFTDGFGEKLRPALVISSDRFNLGDDVVILPISSAPKPNDPLGTFVDTKHPEFAKTGLKQSSSIKWSKPTNIAKKVIKRKLGILPNDLLITVTQNL